MHTNRYGKAKLILQQNKYFIEAENAIMEEIKKIPTIAQAIRDAKEAEAEKIRVSILNSTAAGTTALEEEILRRNVKTGNSFALQ